jgi:hypothetical protein
MAVGIEINLPVFADRVTKAGGGVFHKGFMMLKLEQFNVPRLGEVGFIVGQVRLENPPCLARVVCCLVF